MRLLAGGGAPTLLVPSDDNPLLPSDGGKVVEDDHVRAVFKIPVARAHRSDIAQDSRRTRGHLNDEAEAVRDHLSAVVARRLFERGAAAADARNTRCVGGASGRPLGTEPAAREFDRHERDNHRGRTQRNNIAGWKNARRPNRTAGTSLPLVSFSGESI